jgi:hypothetical protein
MRKFPNLVPLTSLALATLSSHPAASAANRRSIRTKLRLIGSPTISGLLGVAMVLIASSCGQSTSSAALQTPSVAVSPAALPASPSPPPGGVALPAQLLGAWYDFLPPATFNAISSYSCPPLATAANCFYQLTFTTTTFDSSFVAVGGRQTDGHGDVVANGNEIDFFNGRCDGVGRYSWRLAGGLLYLTLIADPCPRSYLYTLQGWSRTH